MPARGCSRPGRSSRSIALTRSPPPRVEAEILAALEDVRRVVDDFVAMRDRMAALGDTDPLLSWLAGGQFVLLGSAEFDSAPTEP